MRLTELVAGIGKLFQSRPQRRRSRAWTKPMVEVLEDRTVPDAVNWIGLDGGMWSAPSNWVDASTGVHRLPGALDNVGFGGAGSTNTSSTDDIANLTVSSITCDASFTKTISIGSTKTLTVSGNFTLDAAGFLDCTPGSGPTKTTLNVNNYFFAHGTLTLESATLTSVGNFQADGTINVTGTGANISSDNLIVSGLLDDFGTLSATSLHVGVGGTVHMESTSGLTVSNSFANQGTINMSGATINANQGLTNSNTIITSALDTITGTVSNNGNITFAGALHKLTINGNYSGLGSLQMRVNAGVTGASDQLSVSGSASLRNGILNLTNIGGAKTGGGWLLVNASSIDGMFGSASLPPGFTEVFFNQNSLGVV